MVSFKTGGLRLLQAAALVSSAAARCTRCSPSDSLLVLFGEQDQSEVAPFCLTFLGVHAPTVVATVTVTPTATASLTTTVVVTDVSTVFEEIITVTVPASVSAAAPTPKNKAKRSIEYPDWLPPTYDTSRVSSACHCLNIVPSATTVTFSATAEAVTVTQDATVTETTSSTLVTIGVVTVTVTPTPTPTANPVPQKVRIAVQRASTGAQVGYIYLSNGPAISTDVNAAITVDITATGGASTLRLTPAGGSVALGFNVAATRELKDFYGSVIADTPTPPGSVPVTSGANAYETDIWTVDTETSLIGWKWIGKDGSVTSPLVLYRVGGRLYPVGSVSTFISATGGVATSKYEVTLKYEVVA